MACHVGHQALATQHLAVLPGVVLLDPPVHHNTLCLSLLEAPKCSGL